MGLALQTVPFYDNGGGLNLKSSPTKVEEDEASISLNVDYSTDGAFRTRNGSHIVNVDVNNIPQQMTGAPTTLLMFDYKKGDGNAYQVFQAGLKIKRDLQTPTDQVLPITIASLNIPDFEQLATKDDDWLFWGNGEVFNPTPGSTRPKNLKFNGTSWYYWSIERPSAPITADGGAGALPAGVYTYYISFARKVGNVIVEEGELSPASVPLTIAINHQVNLTLPALVTPDAQVNRIVIYRASTAPVFSGQVRRLTDIAYPTALYTDNDPSESSILAEFDNQGAPATSIFEEWQGRMMIRDETNKTDLFWSKIDRPWNVPSDNFFIFDGEVRCLHRFYGALFIGTSRSLWIWNGDPDETEPKRISSIIGVLNNRCAVGESFLYIIATNRKFYRLVPTDFSQSEVRIDEPDSIKIEPLLQQIGNAPDGVGMEYYTNAVTAKVMITAPFGTGQNTNNAIIIYNETQSILKQKPVWQFWDNINASTLRQFSVNGVINLYSGDYNGFLWKLDDSTIYGDGAALNGTSSGGNLANTLNHVLVASTATSGGVDTLTDTTQTWTTNVYAQKVITIVAGTGAGQSRTILSNAANSLKVTVPWAVVPDNTSQYQIGNFSATGALVGMVVRIIGGTGVNQYRTIVSNTPTQIVVSPNWTTTPDITSEYTVGGYVVQQGTNWKAIVSGYDFLKQLWFLWANANANGNYNIKLFIQTDFDQTISTSNSIFLNLQSINTIWGAFIWSLAIWGAQSVFQDRFRAFRRFRSIRLIFYHDKAGQPFQINGFSFSVQDKKLFFRST